MAKRLFQCTGWTATATSDSTNLANATYQAIQGATSTQRIDVLEVYWGGLATSSTATVMQLTRTAVVGSSSSALVAPNSDGPEDGATAALLSPPLTYTNCVGGPARSSATSDARLNLAVNAFGGVVRWNAAPTQQWVITGNTTPLGASVLSASNAGSGGSPIVASHIIYEPY